MAAPAVRAALVFPLVSVCICRSERQAHEGPQVRRPIQRQRSEGYTNAAAPLLGGGTRIEVGSI